MLRRGSHGATYRVCSVFCAANLLIFAKLVIVIRGQGRLPHLQDASDAGVGCRAGLQGSFRNVTFAHVHLAKTGGSSFNAIMARTFSN
eukprot:3699216-Rhodomonas_salina.1